MNFEELALKYGTPLYVFNIDEIKKRIEYLRRKLPNIGLCFAIKANSFVIKEIIDDVDRLEVCSNGEYEICKSLEIDKNKIVLSGVYKNEDDFFSIMANKEQVGHFTIESLTQYELLKKLAIKHDRNIDILVRLTSGNQFGINEDEVEKVFADKCPNITIKGLEYFAGTQKHNLRIIEKEMKHVSEFMKSLEDKYQVTLEEIEYGPGFPIYYFQGDEFDEDTYLNEFNELLKTYFEGRTITLEIGRSLVADAGYYLTKVVDMKNNKNGNFVILDGGIHQLVYYGQSMAMKVPYFDILSNNKQEKENDVYNLCGALCTINDLIVKQLEVPKLELGDIFVFKKVGAYSVTEGISLFLSRDLPKVVLIKNNKDELVRDVVNTYKINKPNYKEGE